LIAEPIFFGHVLATADRLDATLTALRFFGGAHGLPLREILGIDQPFRPL
jgi:hypothetical protein